METIKLHAQTDENGILSLSVPLDAVSQEFEVVVVIQAIKKNTIAAEDWPSFVERMYGVLADDPIERPPQLPLTERDPIE